MKICLFYIGLLLTVSCDFYDTQYDILEVSYDFSLAYNTSIDVYNTGKDSIKVYYESERKSKSVSIPPENKEVVIKSHVVDFEFGEKFMIIKVLPVDKIDSLYFMTYEQKKREIQKYMSVEENYEYYIYEKEKYLFFGPLTKDKFKKGIISRGIDSPHWL